MRRYVYSLLIVFLIASFLSACGGDDSNDPADGDATDGDTTDGDDSSDGDMVDGDGNLDGDDSSDGDVTDGDDSEALCLPLSPEELNQALENKDFLLINVHVPYEGEVPGTDTCITYEDPEAIADYIGEDQDKKAVLYCKTNHMSSIACNALLEMGYTNLYYLDGGMNGWVEAGYQLDMNEK